MRKVFGIVLFAALGWQSHAQINYPVKVMTWNVLNWPESNLAPDTTARCPAYRTVVNYVKPDILVTSENRSYNGVQIFLNQVMNTGSYHYEAGTFINGPDTDNSIYYRDSLFHFISNVPIPTALRDISHYTLVFIPTGDTLHIFSMHLKASQGYEPERAAEIAQLRQVTNQFAAGTNFLFVGDFNIYETAEPAYQSMLYNTPNNEGHVNDVITLSGVWNKPAYAHFHTQSTHYAASGGFSGGGMNDRFDMILLSDAVLQPTGFYYVPGSYLNFGNDGNHYDHQINYNTNSAVPMNVADALYDASDHIPVIIDLLVGPTASIEEQAELPIDVNIYPVPVKEKLSLQMTVKKQANVEYSLVDLLGRNIFTSDYEPYAPGQHVIPLDLKGLNEGMYFVLIKLDNYLIVKKILITL